MKKLYAFMAAVALAGSMATMTMAEEMHQGSVSENTMATSNTTCEDCWEKGEFTTDHPVTSRLVTLPLRAVTMAVGMPIGAAKGIFAGVKEGVSTATDVSEVAFDSDYIETDESYTAGNVTSQFLKSVVMFPVAATTTALSIPVGAAVGAVEGTTRGAASGFMLPDKF